MIFPKPVERGDAVFVLDDLVDEVTGSLAQVVFGGSEDTPVFIVRIGGNKEADTSSSYDADRACATIEGV